MSRICLHVLDLAAQLGHSLADAAPVGLDLGLTGPTQTHPAAAATGTTTGLPRHRLTPAAQPRQHVLHLRQRHLRLAFPAGGVLGEDVQDQRGAVDDFDLDRLLQRVQLRRRQFAVADDGVGAGGEHHLTQLLRLARADVGRGIRLAAALDHTFKHLRTRGLGQRGQLGEAGVGVGGAAVGPYADQHHPLEAQLAVLDLGDVGEFGGQPGDAAQRCAVIEGEFTRAGDVGHRMRKVRICHRQLLMVHAEAPACIRFNAARSATIPR